MVNAIHGDPIVVNFYEEISLVHKKDDVYRVEKYWKGRKLKVKTWFGYNKHNSWITESDIQNIG